MAAAASQCRIPSPPAFLDPLTEITNCYFYAVPKYSEMDHPNTRWLLAMIRNDRVDKVKRKIELQPNIFRTSYFQLLDYPQLYSSKDPSATPLFHRQAVLYLTSVGMAIYLRSATILQLMLEYRDPSGAQLYNITEAQYATHVQDTVKGDFHSYPLAAIMLRSGFYDCAPDMLVAQWNPHLPICMPVRRRYERRAFHFLDWLDYVLFLLHDRPLLPLARLVFRLTNDQALYKYKRLPMEVVLPETEDERIPTGLIDVDKVPYDSPMTGIKSLLELAEDYGHYLELKDRRQAFNNCVTQMRADGVNPEVMLAHAQDYDPGYDAAAYEVEGSNNANNNAARSSSKASSRKGKKGALDEGPFVSEPTRILLFAMHNDAKPSTKVAMLPLLDAVAVYVKRNHYLINPPVKSKSQKQSAADKKAKEQQMNLQKRDARNTVVLLLNLLQQQFDKTDRLNKAQRGDKQRPARFKHVDPAKQASNKRRVLTLNIKQLNNLLFMVLLHSGELLDFLESQYPPYQNADVNFRLHPGLEHRLRSIQLDVMAEFNANKIANSYLSMESLERAQEIKELFLNLRVGRPPALDADGLKLHNKNRGGRRNNKAKNNASNVNASSAEEPHLQLLQQQHHQVSFVRVKRRLKAKVEPMTEAEKDAEAADSPPLEGNEGAAAPSVESTSVAATLSEQIDRLRRGVQGGADVALAEIYSRIMEDLKMVAATSEGQEVANGGGQQGKPEDEEEDERHNSNAAAREVQQSAVGQSEEAEDESESDSSNNRRHVVVRRNGGGGGGGGKRWRCRARGGGGGGGAGARRSGHWFQKARVYDAPPGGSEFNLDDTTAGGGAA